MKDNRNRAFVYLFSIFFLTVTSCSPGEPLKTAEEKEREQRVKFRIASVTETKIPFFAGVQQPGQILHESFYDTLGLLVKKTDYRPDGSIECMLTYTYNNDGSLTEYTATDANGIFLYRVSKHYEPRQRLKELYFHLPGGTYKYRNTFGYDKFGRLAEVGWYWPTGFKAKNEYSYSGWNKTSDKEYDPDGRLNYEWTYRYDKDGNLSQAIQVDSQGKISRKILYEYRNDNLAGQSSFVKDVMDKRLIYQYDEKGLLSTITEFNASGKITAKFIFRHDLQKTN